MTSSRFDFFDGTLMEFLAVICGGLVAGTLDALDGVIAFSTQGLNLIQVRWESQRSMEAFPQRYCRSRGLCIGEPVETRSDEKLRDL